MPKFLPTNPSIYIPKPLIWVQCIAFMVLYEFWILPEIVGFRNTALVVGALAGLYPIYQYRSYFFQKRAIPIWMIVGLFAWATFHLFFLSQDYATQLMEFRRIWKYAAIGGIFALGLGLSLANAAAFKDSKPSFWPAIYLGLCLPVLTYLLKYILTIYGPSLGVHTPPYLRIYFGSTTYYVPKTDYVAFCLPVLAISLGQIGSLLAGHSFLKLRQYFALAVYLSSIVATLFLFFIQDIKNGMAYATLCMALFATLFFVKYPGQWCRKALVVVIGAAIFATALYLHSQKNQTWRAFIADIKVASQLDQYPQWKYAGTQGYPNNEFGAMVSVTTYERAAWFKAGVQLAVQAPLGYGLVEDSFKKMAKYHWPEVHSNLSHSHSGWLDVTLAVGFPGLFCILGAIVGAILLSRAVFDPWGPLIFWSLVSNLMLWATTEVSATVSFAALIFWISWGGGLSLIRSDPKMPPT